MTNGSQSDQPSQELPLQGGYVRAFADCWFIYFPPVVMLGIIFLSFGNLFTQQRLMWWILDHPPAFYSMFLCMLIYNSSVYYVMFRQWKLPLTLKVRLGILGWTFLIHPLALPVWRLVIFPVSNDSQQLDVAVSRFKKYCLRSLIVYLSILCLVLAVHEVLKAKSPQPYLHWNHVTATRFLILQF